jgi:hypothetical protein
LKTTGDGSASSVKELAEYFRIYDSCLTHLVYLKQLKPILKRGRRGHSVSEDEKFKISDIINVKEYKPCVMTGRLKRISWKFP